MLKLDPKIGAPECPFECGEAGVQWLFGQCPNEQRYLFSGASLRFHVCLSLTKIRNQILGIKKIKLFIHNKLGFCCIVNQVLSFQVSWCSTQRRNWRKSSSGGRTIQLLENLSAQIISKMVIVIIRCTLSSTSPTPLSWETNPLVHSSAPLISSGVRWPMLLMLL